MFLGEYERTLDDKGRLAIPPEIRSGLGPGAVLTRSLDTCLCIYPAPKWESLARAVDDLPELRYEARSLARSLFSGAVLCEFDRQGRVCIPAFLREHAGIRGDAIIAGVGSRVEVWSKEEWHAERDKFESSGPHLAGELTTSSA